MKEGVSMPVEFKGTVVRQIYDRENFKVYAFAVDPKAFPTVKQNQYQNVSVHGDMPNLDMGTEYTVVATEETGKYGVGYKVFNIRRDAPSTETDILSFLSEVLTEKQAKTLYSAYPNIIDKARRDQLTDIDLSKLNGIGEKTFHAIVRKIKDSFYLFDMIAEFRNIISISIMKKLYNLCPSIDRLKEKLLEKPYTTLMQVSGVGFKSADAMVIKLQEENVLPFDCDIKTSVDRCLSCIVYILQENEDSGNTRMPLAGLRSECFKMAPECSGHFADAIRSDIIYSDKNSLDVALMRTYETECAIAKEVVNGLMNKNNIWNYDLEKYRNVDGATLSNEQMAGISNLCRYPVSILNGFAGSGKSFSVKAILKMLKENHKSFKLLSPTGRAAKVLAAYANEPASTIHRGLGYMPPDTWAYHKDCKLDTDVVIIDEFSMVDIWLFARVLDAIDFNKTKLMLIGDSAQIPSVSCGNLLHDFIASKVIPTTTLTRVFRYNDGGLAKIATDVRNQKPYLNPSMSRKMTVFGFNKDYVFVDMRSDNIPQSVVALYRKLLDKGIAVENIQVITAKNIGTCGAVSLNNAIQKVANPNYGSENHMIVQETTYYENDLVIQKSNNYKAKIYDESGKGFDWDEEAETVFVANGETGVVQKIAPKFIVIKFGNILVRYDQDDMNSVGLGYAMTTHKSQGGSCDHVILCTSKSDVYMLNSNLLYTGLTRMKKKCYHLGEIRTVNLAIKKKADFNRRTFVKQLLPDTIRQILNNRKEGKPYEQEQK